MDPKSGKTVRLLNPFAIWTEFALKSGHAMLDAAQAVVARPKVPTVAVLPAADAPPPKAARAKPSAKPKRARKSASSRARRRGR